MLAKVEAKLLGGIADGQTVEVATWPQSHGGAPQSLIYVTVVLDRAYVLGALNDPEILDEERPAWQKYALQLAAGGPPFTYLAAA